MIGFLSKDKRLRSTKIRTSIYPYFKWEENHKKDRDYVIGAINNNIMNNREMTFSGPVVGRLIPEDFKYIKKLMKNAGWNIVRSLDKHKITWKKKFSLKERFTNV
jgi:hypothetical protein